MTKSRDTKMASLTDRQRACMQVYASAGETGVTSSELGAALRTERETTVQYIPKLEAKGMIVNTRQRRDGPRGRSQYIFTITPKGLAALGLLKTGTQP